MADTTRRYLAATPTDVETAHAAVAPYRDLDVEARLEAWTALQRSMDALLDGRTPVRSPDDIDFWKHWVDPSRGRPR
jgi:hypothetical protein